MVILLAARERHEVLSWFCIEGSDLILQKKTEPGTHGAESTTVCFFPNGISFKTTIYFSCN